MSARDHLKSLPAVVINVPTSTEKLRAFRSHVEPLIGELYIQPAAPIIDKRAEAFAWRDMILDSVASKDPRGHYERVKVFRAQDKTLERPLKQLEYAATYSLYRSVIAVLQFGIQSGFERFVIFEDDAMPRLDRIDELDAPPVDADLAVWGGAMKMGAHKADDKRYLEGRKSPWKRINSAYDRYIATAYEVSQEGARAHLAALLEHPHAVDCSWWYTMEAVPSYHIDPTAFVQVGVSDRIASRTIIREGVYRR